MMALSELKGLGKTRLETLNQAGIETMADLLLTLPLRYQDTSVITPLEKAAPGMEICVSGYPKAAPRLSRFRGLSSVTLRLCDETGSVPVVWYNQPWLQTQIHPEDCLTLYGRIDRDRQGRVRMASPLIVRERGILPVDRALSGLPPQNHAGIDAPGADPIGGLLPRNAAGNGADEISPVRAEFCPAPGPFSRNQGKPGHRPAPHVL